MDTVSVVYCGPFDEVEVAHAGIWLTFRRGEPVPVPRTLAEGDPADPAGNSGGLLAQDDIWQAAKAAKNKPATAGE